MIAIVAVESCLSASATSVAKGGPNDIANTRFVCQCIGLRKCPFVCERAVEGIEAQRFEPERG